MRHPEPPIVTHYWATLKSDPPKVCHMCDHYTPQGICAEFDAEPPQAFASEPGACSFWSEGVPF